MKTNGFKTAFFRKFLASYLLILVIPLLLASLAYNSAVNVIEKGAIESSLSMLKQTRDITDKHFQELDEMAMQISFDPKTKSLLFMKDPASGSPELYNMWDYARDLKYRTLTNNIFKSTFFVFLKNNSFIFSHDTTNYDFKKFYANFFSYSDISYEQWYESYFGEYHYKSFLPSRRIKIDTAENTAITYLCSLPMVKDLQPQGVIAFLIDEGEILKPLSGMLSGYDGWIAITDKSGTILSEFPKEKHIGEDISFIGKYPDGYMHKDISGKDMILVHATSAYNGLSFAAIFPHDAVTAKAGSVRQTAWIIALVTLLLGVLVSLLLAYRNTKPFKEVLGALREFLGSEGRLKMGESANEYDFLKGGVSHLISSTKNMQESLARQSSALKTVFLDRLLKGELDSRKRMETLLSYIGLDIAGESFIVIVMRMNKIDNLSHTAILEEQELFRVILEDTLHKHFQGKGELHILNENEMAMLLSFTASSGDGYCQFIEAVIRATSLEIGNRFHLLPTFGIGGVYHDLFDVHYSFREAVQAIEASYGAETGSAETVLWYNRLARKKTAYFYPTELEMKLIHLTKAGNWAEVESILKRIYEENFVRNTLPKSLEKYLLYEMKATLIKLLGEIDSDADFNLLEEYSIQPACGNRKVFDGINSIYWKMCKSVEENMKSHNSLLIGRILDCINTHFQDGNLSVCSLASEFNLSESYFSQFFKEQTGENFSSYLESLRISHACRLITQTDSSIDEISLQSGYNNSNSFRRAFKRVTGVAPSMYH